MLPEGIASTGYPAVEATCREIGIRFDDWQEDLNRCILAKAPGGEYAADTVVISIARQVGKTFDVGALVFADSIINPGTTTVWTAHRFKVSRETFTELRAMASSPRLAAHIDPDAITSAAGNECIPFRNGSRIMFAARERGAIRGFTKVRRLVLDEAQILTESALSDMAPTMNQADNPQIILMGTPPKPGDPSDVFTNLRAEALEGISEGVLYVELSADPDAKSDDREAWRQANPSYPRRTPAKAIQRMRKLLADEDFRREGLGIWDADALHDLIAPNDWGALHDVERVRPNPVAFSLAVSPDRQWSSIGLAGRRSDGARHVQIVQSGRGTGWLIPRLSELVAEWSPVAVALNPGSPAGSLLPDLAEAKIDICTLTEREYQQACGMFIDGVDPQDPEDVPTIFHSGQPVVAVAIGGARKRHAGAGAFSFRPAGSDIDISPLEAITVALYALATNKPRKRGGERRAVLL